MDLRIQRTRKSIINAFIELRAAKPLEKNEVITSILNDIPHPEYLVTHPKQDIIELTSAFSQQGNLFNILFFGTRQGILIDWSVKSFILLSFKFFCVGRPLFSL